MMSLNGKKTKSVLMIEIGYMFLTKSDIWTLCKYESYFVSYKFSRDKELSVLDGVTPD